MKDKIANRQPDSPVRLALHGRRAGVAKHCGQVAGRLREGKGQWSVVGGGQNCGMGGWDSFGKK
ncbi:MAG: hypothetical protein U9N82_06530 [Thermodesulfobacteriota bacterium]|nr:hypothetical protein [Thermodesulfobacteriota bacterium]